MNPIKDWPPEHRAAFWLGIISSAVVTILILSAALVFAFLNQGKIINYFARQIVRAGEAVTGNGIDGPTAPLLNQEALVINAVSQASPAVISIIVSKNIPVFETLAFRQKSIEKQEVGGGTGFLITKDGLAITNKHLVADDQAEYTALTKTGEKYEVEIVAKDPVLDIAVIKIKGQSDFPFLEFSLTPPRVGQTAIAIGNALGEFKNTVSVGIISGLARAINAANSAGGQVERLDEVIQTDAAINPGNSGGVSPFPPA